MYNTPNNQFHPTDELIISKGGRRLRPVTEREVFKREQYEMDFRFVREVERLERERRVPGRVQLENSIGMEKGGLSSVRAGVRSVGLVQAKVLFEKYRGDMWFIIFGVRNKELTGPYVPGIGNIARYEGYIHRYTSSARWKVGSRPESQPEYYPLDPDNEQWRKPSRIADPDNPRRKKPVVAIK